MKLYGKAHTDYRLMYGRNNVFGIEKAVNKPFPPIDFFIYNQVRRQIKKGHS